MKSNMPTLSNMKKNSSKTNNKTFSKFLIMKYFPILLAGILTLSLTSCSKNDEIVIKKNYGTFTV